MPIYEYRCPDCRKVHEVLRSVSDDGAYNCPRCLKPMQKLVSMSSFQLKGGGWYADGYCKKTKEKTPDIKSTVAAKCGSAGDGQSCKACS